MNNQTEHQVGRLTGRVELDAGLMRYRGLLATQRLTAMRGRASRTQHPMHATKLWRQRRKVAAAALAALLVVAALSVAVLGQGATAGVLYFTSSCNGGFAMSRVSGSLESTAFESVDPTGRVSGSLEVLAAAEALDANAQYYNGENCLGNCRFTR